MELSRLNATQSPQFTKEQYVGFIGGRGQIKSLWTESGAWVYAVEIARQLSRGMNDCSKKATVLLLHEAELWEETEALLPDLALPQGFSSQAYELVS